MESSKQTLSEDDVKRALNELFDQTEEKIRALTTMAEEGGELTRLRDEINETLMALNLGIVQILNRAKPFTTAITNFIGKRLSQLWGQLIGLFTHIQNQIENWSISAAVSISIPSSATFELTVTFKP